MLSPPASVKLPTLQQVIDPAPLVVGPDVSVLAVMMQMNQIQDSTCSLESTAQAAEVISTASCALVVEGEQLVGLLTERDIVQLSAAGRDLATVPIVDVMTRSIISLSLDETQTVLTALNLLQQYQIRHLPVLDRQGHLVGLITPYSIRRVLQPANLLKLRRVAEVMTTAMISAPPTASVLSVTQLMTEHHVSCVVIHDATPQPELQSELQSEGKIYPLGMLTERDIVQFQILQLDLAQIPAQMVMSTPLFFTHPQDSLWDAHQSMQRRRVRRLGVVNDHGELVGLITQTHLLEVFDPIELSGVVDTLQQQVEERTTQLEQINQQLRQAQEELENRVQERTIALFEANQRLQEEIQERHHAEAELRHSQQQLTDFVENATIGMHWVAADGQILWANQAELDLLGYTREEYIGHPIAEFHVESEVIDDILCRLTNNEILNSYPARLRTKDGSIRDVLINSNVYWENGEFVHTRCFTRDVTSQVHTEQERQLAEKTLRETLQSLEFQKFALDQSAIVAITDRQGTITEINDQFCQISQYSRTELVGQNHRIINSGFHPPEFFRSLWATIASGNVWQGEIKNRAKDGSFYWVATTIVPGLDGDGQPSQYLSVRFDITQRKEAEEKIREQAALLDVTTDAIIFRDFDNRILFWNHGAERLYGWSAAEALGQLTTTLLYKNLPQLQDARQTVIEQGEWQGELEKINKLGKAVVVQSRWTLVRDEVSHPKAILSVDTDITEKKLLADQFLHAQRLESLGTLASGIAHDLNNILTPILAIAQLLPLKLPDLDEGNQRLLQMLQDSSKRGSDLVSQILSFARGAEGKRATIQVGHLLHEVGRVVKQTFPKSIRVSEDVNPPDLWMLSADATQLHQVFMNLCINARDAMPEGGTLTLEAKNMMLDATYAKMHLDAKAGPYIVITIADTGTGIAPEVLDRMFEPFFTTKELGKGTGLGLSTVLTIVKQHSGFMTVYSEPNKGTHFRVYLPALEGFDAPQSPERLEALAGNGELILVVDDEASIREITKISLETHNYQVITASDGIDAFSLYAEHKQSISVVILDLMMPLLDTATIILTLKKMNPQVQIIAMSGLAPNQAITASDPTMIQAFLAKPFTTHELLQSLHQIINKSSTNHQQTI
jgi:PAS domain S-box-containing protein